MRQSQFVRGGERSSLQRSQTLFVFCKRKLQFHCCEEPPASWHTLGSSLGSKKALSSACGQERHNVQYCLFLLIEHCNLPGEEGFWKAITTDPNSDVDYLVFADWLEDRDDPRGPELRQKIMTRKRVWVHTRMTRLKAFAYITGRKLLEEFEHTTQLQNRWVERISLLLHAAYPLQVLLDTESQEKQDAVTTFHYNVQRAIELLQGKKRPVDRIFYPINRIEFARSSMDYGLRQWQKPTQEERTMYPLPDATFPAREDVWRTCADIIKQLNAWTFRVSPNVDDAYQLSTDLLMHYAQYVTLNPSCISVDTVRTLQGHLRNVVESMIPGPHREYAAQNMERFHLLSS